MEENGAIRYQYDANNKYLTHSIIENGFDIIEFEQQDHFHGITK